MVIADKPRDIYVQYAMAWLTPKTRPSPRVTLPNLFVLGQKVRT